MNLAGSFFCVEQSTLTYDEMYSLILYCGSKRDTEHWQLDVEKGWASAYCFGEDVGKFYEFLQVAGMDKKVEIIRG